MCNSVASRLAAARLHGAEPASPPQTDTPTSRLCRFCQEPERSDSADGELITPCSCQGGLRYVHLKCLRKHQYAAARAAGVVAAHFCNVCKSQYFVGFPSVPPDVQAKCDALLQQLRPGSLLVAHADKQTSSGGAWARTVILLASRRSKESVERGSTSWRLLDTREPALE